MPSLCTSVSPLHRWLFLHEISLAWSSVSCSVEYLFWPGPLPRLQGNLCSSIWSISSPSSFTNLGVCRVVSHSSSPLPLTLHCRILPFLNCLFPEVPLGRGAQLCPAAGPLELSGTGCVQHGASPVSSHRGHPCTPPTSKTLLRRPNRVVYNAVSYSQMRVSQLLIFTHCHPEWIYRAKSASHGWACVAAIYH